MSERVRKPEWLKISIGANERYTETKTHCKIPQPAHDMQQRTLSQYGRMLGKRYGHFYDRRRYLYRCCKFCNTQTGKPMPLDPQEPVHVAESIALMKLSTPLSLP